MRQIKSQKAIEKSLSHVCNSLWQFGCPWVASAPVTTVKPIRSARQRKSRLHSTAALLFVATLFTAFAVPQASAQTKSDSVIVLASLNTKMPSPYHYNNGLFGATEQKYSDTSAFTKWNGVIAKFQKDFKNSLNKKHVQDWMSFLASLENATKTQKIEAVNAYMNKKTFVSDIDNYGKSDYWATPMEFLKKSGDCEDYAIAKYISLQALGIDSNEMRLAVVYDHVMRMPHAILIVYEQGQAKVLDNQNKAVLTSNDITRYKPIYSISEVAWWRH